MWIASDVGLVSLLLAIITERTKIYTGLQKKKKRESSPSPPSMYPATPQPDV